MAASDERIWQMARGFNASRILLTANELGVFAALGDEAKTSADVAERIKADRRATDRLMNALVALGLLVKEGNLFRNSPDAAEFLVPGKPGYMGGALGHMNNLWDNWSTLTESVCKGTSVLRREGKARDEWLVPFIAAMHHNASEDAARIAKLVGLEGVRRMLDVGGGSGVYSIEFCKAEPGLKAVVFDMPDVIPLTKGYIEEAGLSDRIDTVSGDFTVDELGKDFDLVLLSQIIHAYGPEAIVELFRKCRRALRDGGRLVIQDFIMDETRTTPPHGAVFALNMLVATTNGDTYTEAEVTEWLMSAGFADPERLEPGTGASILIAGT